MQCRSHAAQLGRLYNEFKAKNIEIVLILGDSTEKAKRYVESLHLPFPVLADPTRSIYHQYGLDKVAYLIQRTASIVIDCDGIIRYVRTTTSPMVWLQESREIEGFIKSLPAAC